MNLSELYKKNNNMLDRIKTENPDIIKLVDEKIEGITKRGDVKNFLYVFLSNIKYCVDKEKYEEFSNKIMKKQSLNRIIGSSSHEFSFSYNPDVELATFNHMLKTQYEKHGRQYIEDGLDFAFEKEEEKNTNMIDSFLRYLAITNFKNLQCVETFNSISDSLERYECQLDGYALGKVSLEYPEEDEENLEPDMLQIRSGLQSAKIGQVLLKYLMERAHEKAPDKSLVSHTVMRCNKPAIKLYERMGGVFYVDGERIDGAMEPSNSTEFCTVEFDKSNFFKIENMVIEPPKLYPEKKQEPKNEQVIENNKEKQSEEDKEK